MTTIAEPLIIIPNERISRIYYNKFKVIFEIIKVVYMVLSLNSICENIIFFLLPFVSAMMNIYVNNMLLKLAQYNNTNNDMIKNIVIKCIYDYISSILLQKLIFNKTRQRRHELILRLNMSKIKCAVPIPGKDQKTFQDLHEDNYKLADFLIAIPLFWVCIISFIVSIYNIKNKNGIPYQLIFTILCMSVFCIMMYITDSSLYEKTKPNATTITSFNDSDYVKLKLAMGCKLDIEHGKIKRHKQNLQQEYQKYLMCIINFSITFISIYTNTISLIYTFGNIIWMLGTLADNIKSFFYYDYVKDFIRMFLEFEKHSYKSENETNIDNFNSIIFSNASFGYYKETLASNDYTIKINNLTYTFECGNLYYLEAPNGIGKSTLLKMFMSNLFSGNIYFDQTNRNNVSFEDLYKNIFHIVQASEYTPKFSLDEVESYKGRDVWLEERLKLDELLNKSSVEISGGQKKRVYIYMALTSSCKVLLLDEILSELSTEDTPDVPEGGGWLSRVLNTIMEWQGLESKIIILVGHGLLNLIHSESKSNVHKIKIETENYTTSIKKTN
jgi:ABC-type cobalamin/Fe3+-siderophores transport system ATPase subunit